MKPDEVTPNALLKFFTELESGGTDEECELHYGCGCVIGKGLKAAQMLVAVQKALGVEIEKAGESGATAPGTDGAAGADAQLSDFEAALLAPGFPKAAAPAGPDAESVARIKEAEGEIDRLLMQTVDLKAENKKLREKIRELYKQIERLYTRSEMSKLLGSLDEKIAKEAEASGTAEAEWEDEGGTAGDEEGSTEPEAAGAATGGAAAGENASADESEGEESEAGGSGTEDVASGEESPEAEAESGADSGKS